MGRVCAFEGEQPRRAAIRFGAGDRIRTGDIDLGKVALYQLSYSRVGAPIRRENPDYSER